MTKDEIIKLYFDRIGDKWGAELSRELTNKKGLTRLYKEITNAGNTAKANRRLPPLRVLYVVSDYFSDEELVTLLEYKVNTADLKDFDDMLYLKIYKERPNMKRIRRAMREKTAFASSYRAALKLGLAEDRKLKAVYSRHE